jgi:hypothetical protein
MPKIEIEDPSAQILILLVVLIILLSWAVRDARRLHSLFRLSQDGQTTDADVIHTGIWSITAWPYRVEYRFQVDGETYQEPGYRGYRTSDIGAPVSRTVWRNAEAAGTLRVRYLPANPARNRPADLGPWLWIYGLERIFGLAFRLTLALFLVVGLTDLLDGARIGGAVESVLLVLGVVGLAGWLVLLPLLRIAHLVTGFRDMGPVDLLTSLAITVLNVGVGGVLLTAVFKGFDHG